MPISKQTSTPRKYCTRFFTVTRHDLNAGLDKQYRFQIYMVHLNGAKYVRFHPESPHLPDKTFRVAIEKTRSAPFHDAAEALISASHVDPYTRGSTTILWNTHAAAYKDRHQHLQTVCEYLPQVIEPVRGRPLGTPNRNRYRVYSGAAQARENRRQEMLLACARGMTAFAPVVDVLDRRNAMGNYTTLELVELRSRLQQIHASIMYFRDLVFTNKVLEQHAAESAPTPIDRRTPPQFVTPTTEELARIAEEWQ